VVDYREAMPVWATFFIRFGRNQTNHYFYLDSTLPNVFSLNLERKSDSKEKTKTTTEVNEKIF
jgi:hypothetical protein